ncbi:MAG: hypothetical protein KC502_23300 [Myxococcales bacterium]|nr:hypothetical protein [Myxococcales bacterium]
MKRKTDKSPDPARPRGGPAWVDERNLERGNMRVAQGFSKLRTDAAFEEANDCAACTQARTESDDSDALCDDHLAQAMGMNSDW